MVVGETPALVVLDAGGELGQVACKKAMELAIKKAEQSGVGVVSVGNAGDAGLLAYYTMMALEHDCIGMMFNNTNPYVAPWGGRERILGIDPVSIAIPAGKQKHIVVDMALTPAQEQFDSQTMWTPPFPNPPLLFFSTVREYCLEVAVELLSGALSGMPLGRDKVKRGECGVFCMAIHVPHFIPIQEFKNRVDRYVTQVKSSQLADGFTEILMPGERGFVEQEKRLKEGISVPDTVWENITRLAEEIGVNWKKVLDSA